MCVCVEGRVSNLTRDTAFVRILYLVYNGSRSEIHYIIYYTTFKPDRSLIQFPVQNAFALINMPRFPKTVII